MSVRWGGIARAGGLLAVGAGLVAASVTQTGSVQLADPSAAVATPTPAVVAVRQSTLVCPGPETEGIGGVPAVPGGVSSVLAAAATPAALAGIPTSPDPGTLAVTAQPAGTTLATTAARGATVTGTLSGPTIAEVRGAGTLAGGTAALQTWLRRDSDDRGLVAAACQAPRAEAWLLGGGGDPTRRERLVVANPGANAVTVDLEVHGSAGPIATVGGSRLAVPPHGRIGVLLDALAPGQPSPAVRVTASGGLVTAVLEDSWIEGAVGRGRDDSGPADGPGTEAVLPAFLSGPARLRLVVPGTDEAVVQTRVLTVDGPQALPADAVVRVAAGAVRDLDLSALPPGAYAVQVRSDRPVAAAVLAERRSPAGPSDLAWLAAPPAIPVLGGTPVVPGATAGLLVTGTGAGWSAAVYLVAADGTTTTKAVVGAPDTVSTLDVTGAAAVWVRPASGTVRAAVSFELPDPSGPLFAVVPVLPAPTTTTDLPVREVRG